MYLFERRKPTPREGLSYVLHISLTEFVPARKLQGKLPLTRFAGAPLKEGSRDPVRYWLPSTEGSQRNQAS